MYTGYIYRHFIEIDGIEYSYVGKTTKNPEERWKDGWGYIYKNKTDGIVKTKFARAIMTYGWINFKHEIIIEVKCKTKNEVDELLNDLEIEYIDKYNSYYNGFNSSIGGSYVKGDTHKKVRLVNTGEVFDSARIASEKYGISNWRNMQKCCRGVKKSCGKHPITKEKLIWEYV